MYAGAPLTVTLTPSRLVGILSPTKSDPAQIRVSPAGARFEPLISTHVFGAITGAPPSALATSVIAGAATTAPRLRKFGKMEIYPTRRPIPAIKSAPLFPVRFAAARAVASTWVGTAASD